MEANLARSMWMPVVTGFPVFGQRIINSPIATCIAEFMEMALV